MAQATDQHTPTEWGEERWTLNQAFDYLTVTLGYSEGRALHEMERERLARHLAVKVHKVVDGKPQGDSEYLPFNKKHKLVRHLGWVVPRNHKWGDNRWTVYKQRVLELWPLHTPAAQTAAEQQPEDKIGAGRVPAAPPSRAAKGPVRGEIDRFGDADRALFPEIERLMKSQRLTSTEAVRQIPEDKLAGRGTLDSRIRRVSDLFRREKL